MHWGIRRYQPYGQGYDPKHEGKEIGLAARMGGQGGSYSSVYANRNRGSLADRAKSAASRLGKSASRGINEGLERLNYAQENIGRKAKSALSKYATGGADLSEYYTFGDIADSAYNVFRDRAKAAAKNKINSIKTTGIDGVKAAMGMGFSRFQNAMDQTRVNSKQFIQNAKATAGLLAGAFDPTSSARELITGRYGKNTSKGIGAEIGGKDMNRLSSLGYRDPKLQGLSSQLREKYGRSMSYADMWDMGFKGTANKLHKEAEKRDIAAEYDRWAKKNFQGKYHITMPMGNERSVWDYNPNSLRNRLEDQKKSWKSYVSEGGREAAIAKLANVSPQTIKDGQDLARRLGIGI